MIGLPEPPLAWTAEDTELPRRSPSPRLYSRLPRSSAWPSRVMREDGRSRRYLAWQPMMFWNSGRRLSWSKSKYTTRWRRQASESRSEGPEAPGAVGAVVTGALGVVSTGGGGTSLTRLAQAMAEVQSTAVSR